MSKCDKCGAPGREIVAHEDFGLLTFCGHHFTALAAALAKRGWSVVSNSTPVPE